ISEVDKEGNEKAFANPQIQTLDGRAAVFHSGGHQPVVLANGGVDFVPFGIQVDARVTSRKDGRLCADVSVSHSSPAYAAIKVRGASDTSAAGDTQADGKAEAGKARPETAEEQVMRSLRSVRLIRPGGTVTVDLDGADPERKHYRVAISVRVETY